MTLTHFLSPRRRLPALFGLLGLFLLLRCGSAASTNSGGTGGNTGSDGAATGGTEDRENIDITISESGGTENGGGEALDPLCGDGECIPDDASGCEALGSGGTGGTGGTGGMGGSWGGAAGLSANPGDLDEVSASCQIGPGPTRSCQEAGVAEEGDPCLSVRDCGSGLACVGSGTTGVCRPYCCRGTVESCDDTSYCAPRPTLGDPNQEVPVCLPLDNCSLTEPFPCPEGQDCACTGEMACMVVRADGKTACAIPGEKTAGEACDPNAVQECAYGHVCSSEQGCLVVCSTVSEESGCQEDELCQAASRLPKELGVCVGGDDESP